MQHRRKSSKSACGSQTKPEWILIRGFFLVKSFAFCRSEIYSRTVPNPSTASLFYTIVSSCVGLLVRWEYLVQINSIQKQIKYFVVFTPKHLVSAAARWCWYLPELSVSPQKGAAPYFCITQKINEASSCRETSLFKVHRCSRKQQFF